MSKNSSQPIKAALLHDTKKNQFQFSAFFEDRRNIRPYQSDSAQYPITVNQVHFCVPDPAGPCFIVKFDFALFSSALNIQRKQNTSSSISGGISNKFRAFFCFLDVGKQTRFHQRARLGAQTVETRLIRTRQIIYDCGEYSVLPQKESAQAAGAQGSWFMFAPESTGRVVYRQCGDSKRAPLRPILEDSVKKSISFSVLSTCFFEFENICWKFSPIRLSNES